MILEACVETLEDALLAEKSGANRIELCGDLGVGGVSPSEELTVACFSKLKIPIMAMVRPRGGNFVYSEAEFVQMKKSIQFFKEVGVAGVVFGILNQNNEVDTKRTKELAELASPFQVTFHKAIDETPDIMEAVEKLKSLGGIQRILTSGGKATALEGAEVIKKMMEIANEKITMIAAGKVTMQNLHQIQSLINTTEYHGKRIVF